MLQALDPVRFAFPLGPSCDNPKLSKGPGHIKAWPDQGGGDFVLSDEIREGEDQKRLMQSEVDQR
jgi:hypothetical protein